MKTRSTPSFRGLAAASGNSSFAKQRNRSSDTVHEKLLRAILWREGLRYRKNVASLPGKPDIVFTASKIAVFCDGDFWHGRNWQKLSAKLTSGANPAYWLLKIRTNRDRDIRMTKQLQEAGWTVLRFWETDILRDPEAIASRIADTVRAKSSANETQDEVRLPPFKAIS